jgi:hypothetical protein
MADPSSELPAGLRPRIKPAPIVLGVAVVLVVLVVGSLFMPVCEPILDRDVAAFETVMPLGERAARGEPFKRKGAHWYQCQTRLARLFFF